MVDTNHPNWIIGADYVLTVSNVKDVRGNSIIPGSQIDVSWPVTTELISTNQLWSFHNSASLEPDVAERDWFATNFVESAFWSSGCGVFHADPNFTSCFGTLGTNIVYQPEPILFPTTFERPDALGSSASLSMRLIADDGAVLYLNGQEIYRTNMAPQGWPLDASSRALSDRSICTPVSISLTNLLPRTNWLAAAIYDNHGTSDGRVYFGLELMSFHYRTPELPTVVEPAPTLHFTRLPDPDYRLVMSWAGKGFSLEGTDTFTNSLSYPFGPWIQATNMANPYTNSATSPFRFYRLKK